MKVKYFVYLILFILSCSIVLGASIIQIRRDVASAWSTSNPILAQGEIGLETDTSKIKFGNGTNVWNDLPYYTTSPTVNTDTYINATCAAGDYFESINGTTYGCSTPSGFTDTQINLNNPFLYNESGEGYFNNTYFQNNVTQLIINSNSTLTSLNIIDFGFIIESNTTNWDKDVTNDLDLSALDNITILRTFNLSTINDDLGLLNKTEIESYNGTWSDSSYSDDWINISINTTIQNEDVNVNTSLKDYTDNLNGTWQDITISNCSVDNSCSLITYDSELNYTDNTDTYINATCISGSVFESINGTIYGCTTLSSYDDIWINTTIDSKDVNVNLSMKNYTDNLNGTWIDNSENLTEQNIFDFGFIKLLNITQSFVQTLGFYLTTEVYNKTEIDDNNLTVINYIEGLNGTWEDIDTDTNYSDTWINTTIDSKDVNANLSMKNYTDNLNGTWLDIDTNTQIGNCSVDGSCPLITYDSELNYTDNTDTYLNATCVSGSIFESINGTVYGCTPLIIYSDTWINTTIITTNDSMETYVDNLNGTWIDIDTDTNYSDSWINTSINTTIQNEDVTVNTSLKDYTDNLNGTWLDIDTDTNYSDTWINLSINTTIQNEDVSVNLSLKTYTDNLNGTWLDIDTDTNYSDTWINTTIITTNDSMGTYVDNLNGTWIDNSENLTDDNIKDFGYLKFLNLTDYITDSNTSWVDDLIGIKVIQSFIQNLGFYTTTEVYNKTEIDNLNGTWEDSDTIYIDTWINTTIITTNDSMETYVDNLNGTWIDIDTDTNYSDSWINTTIDTKVVNANTSMKDYTDNLNGTWYDDDTTYSAGNGISEALTVFSVAGGTALTQDVGGLSVTDGGIGDTQIADAYINQALTTTSDVTHADITADNITSINCIYFDSGGRICSN